MGLCHIIKTNTRRGQWGIGSDPFFVNREGLGKARCEPITIKISHAGLVEAGLVETVLVEVKGS